MFGLAVLVMLSACERPQPRNVVDNAVEPAAPALPAVAGPETLDRAGFLAAVAQAASAEASGSDDSTAQRLLDGRQFELRIRFGCRAQSTNLRQESLGWSFDTEGRTLRVRAMPTLSAQDAVVRGLGGGEFEAVEGFWVPRPWLLVPACPSTAAASSPAPEAAAEDSTENAVAIETAGEAVPRWPRVGIAQFFTVSDSRTGRRSMRPYEAVKVLATDQPPGAQGFDLVLSGRLKALPDKGVILCTAKGADSPPECVASAQFHRVRIENPGTGDIIAEWGKG